MEVYFFCNIFKCHIDINIFPPVEVFSAENVAIPAVKKELQDRKKCPFFLVSYHMEGALLLVNLVFNRHALRVFCGFPMIIIRLVLSRDVRGETKSKILGAG